MSTTLFALLGFLSWTLALLVLMETIRSKRVLTRQVAANGFSPDNAGLSLFMQRLARASTAPMAVMARFGAFAVQMGIAVYWAVKLHAA